jgi:hypothetical protein
VAGIDPDAYRFLSVATHDVKLWWRATMDAFERLEAAERERDYQGALIAAAETLHALALIRAWVVAVLPRCDDELRQQFEMFERDHPEMRAARNVHEHADDYERSKGKDIRLTGVVHYERVPTDPPGDWNYGVAPSGPPPDWSKLVISLSTVTAGGDPVRVNLTRATRDAVDLAMHAEEALGRAFHRESSLHSVRRRRQAPSDKLAHGGRRRRWRASPRSRSTRR